MKHIMLYTNITSIKFLIFFLKRTTKGDLPCCPVVMTSPSKAGGGGSIPGWGTKIPHASGPKKTKHKTEAIL